MAAVYMYLDLSCYDNTETEASVQAAAFAAVEHLLNGISVFSYFLPTAKSSILEQMVLSAPIDYPYGVSDTIVRNQAVLSAIRKGANAIDLVANHNLLLNKLNKFFEDIEGIQAICKENKAILRLIVEYRFFDTKQVIAIANTIREIGIEYILPTTNSLTDAWQDNLVIANEITKNAKINVITNGNIWQKSHFNFIKEAEIFGVRFSSMGALINIFG